MAVRILRGLTFRWPVLSVLGDGPIDCDFIWNEICRRLEGEPAGILRWYMRYPFIIFTNNVCIIMYVSLMVSSPTPDGRKRGVI